MVESGKRFGLKEQYPDGRVVDIRLGDCELSISLDGAYVNNLKIDGRDVLTPRFINEKGKDRGGMHVCLPQFGTDEVYGLPQHGFGRKLAWDLMENDSSKVVLFLPSFKTAPKEKGVTFPEGLEALMTYELTDESTGTCFRATLTVLNRGDQPMSVTPGFHPYFDLDGATNFRIQKTDSITTQYITDPLTEPLLVTLDEETKVEFGEKPSSALTLKTNLTNFVFWTDSPNQYVCLEPTKAGGILNEQQRGIHMVYPGEDETYQLSIYLPARVTEDTMLLTK